MLRNENSNYQFFFWVYLVGISGKDMPCALLHTSNGKCFCFNHHGNSQTVCQFRETRISSFTSLQRYENNFWAAVQDITALLTKNNQSIIAHMNALWEQAVHMWLIYVHSLKSSAVKLCLKGHNSDNYFFFFFFC